MIFRIFYSNELKHVTATIGERHRFQYNMFSPSTQWNRTIQCVVITFCHDIYIFLFSFSQIEEIVGHRVNILITCVVQAIYMNKSGSMPQYLVQSNAPRSYNKKLCRCASREELLVVPVRVYAWRIFIICLAQYMLDITHVVKCWFYTVYSYPT